MDKEYQELEELFRLNRKFFVAFGDYRRQDVMVALWDNKDMTVKDLAHLLNMPRPTVSHHIKILKDAGLLKEQKSGVRTYYQPSLRTAVDSIRVFLDKADKIIDC
ncbi:winged helix-turn-helix transcriptional regulator [Candidatus Saccharibacteria bacterium TM7i]|nr:winged helix-turn-helix transcriptional regulator [Candidatus Saccharibacteria bacterium TM7i]